MLVLRGGQSSIIFNYLRQTRLFHQVGGVGLSHFPLEDSVSVWIVSIIVEIRFLVDVTA